MESIINPDNQASHTDGAQSTGRNRDNLRLLPHQDGIQTEHPAEQGPASNSSANHPYARRGKGKGKAGLRRIKSLDEDRTLHAWKEEVSSTSPDEKRARRNQSEEPDKDRKGNMFYKIDPQLMTNFMRNVSTTQQEIQSTLDDQQRDIANEQKQTKRELTEWYHSLTEKLDKDRLEAKAEIRQRIWEEQASAKLSATDETGPWRTQVNSAIDEMIKQQQLQNSATDRIAGQLQETVHQVKGMIQTKTEIQNLNSKVDSLAENFSENRKTGRGSNQLRKTTKLRIYLPHLVKNLTIKMTIWVPYKQNKHQK